MDISTNISETISSNIQSPSTDTQSSSTNNQTASSDNQAAYSNQQMSHEPRQISSNEDHTTDDQTTERFRHITTADPTEEVDKEKNHIDVKENREDKEKDEEEDREKGEDEQKEVEKTLLEDDSIRIEITDGSSPLGDEGEDTPTLPMPDKKRQKEKELLKKPSTYLFPITRLRKAWNSSSNILEFMIRATCIICTSLGWLFCVGGFPFVSIVMLIMGSVYIDDCPAKPEIPIYLVVAGVFGTVQHVFAIWTKYVPRDTESPGSKYRGWCLCVDFLLQFFLGIWFILGCVWVYGIYEPEYEVADYPGEIKRYCSKSVYLFTFWILNISFITLAILICFAFCCMISIAASSGEEVIKQ